MYDHYADLIAQFLEKMDALPFVKSSDIPDIPLYMDQVTTFMEEKLRPTRRFEKDKLLTKTMINNYTKNKLLPPSDKKKYSREHILILTFIYYFKGILSLQDIQSILSPVAGKYFSSEDGPDIGQVFEEVFRIAHSQMPGISQEILAYLDSGKEAFSEDTFQNLSAQDRDFLQRFALICSLSLDVYMKKRVIEQLIDDCNAT